MKNLINIPNIPDVNMLHLSKVQISFEEFEQFKSIKSMEINDESRIGNIFNNPDKNSIHILVQSKKKTYDIL